MPTGDGVTWFVWKAFLTFPSWGGVETGGDLSHFSSRFTGSSTPSSARSSCKAFSTGLGPPI